MRSEKLAKLTIQQVLSKKIKPDDYTGIHRFSESHTAGNDTEKITPELQYDRITLISRITMALLIEMVKVYKASEVDLKGRAGYGVKYVADIGFTNPIESAGFILVRIPPNMKTTPHAHGKLDEAFMIMNPTRMGVGETLYDLDEGDVVLVEPSERHWFETSDSGDVTILAVKLPNLKDDKIETD